MTLLLDTHIAIWSVSRTARLPQTVIEFILANPGGTYVSAMSLLEIAIKHSLPRRDPPPFGAETALRFFVEAGYQMLDVQPHHSVGVERLANVHSDPFDRLMISQAISEGMQFVTMDRLLAAYHPNVLTF